MKTKEQREADFRAAILAVCTEHGAELDVTDDRADYGIHQGVLRVSMMSVYDIVSNELVEDFCEFDW